MQAVLVTAPLASLHELFSPPDMSAYEQSCTAGVQLARLQAISHGETTLTTQRWQKMRKLEHARAERTRASKS